MLERRSCQQLFSQFSPLYNVKFGLLDGGGSCMTQFLPPPFMPLSSLHQNQTWILKLLAGPVPLQVLSEYCAVNRDA